MRDHYEQEIANLKAMYEAEYQHLNQQVAHFQGICGELEQRYNGVVFEFEEYRRAGVPQGSEEVWQQVEFFRQRVVELEHEREHLINVIENYKAELYRRTEESNLQGSEIIQSESLDRVTTQVGGQEQIESIERVTYQEGEGE